LEILKYLLFYKDNYDTSLHTRKMDMFAYGQYSKQRKIFQVKKIEKISELDGE